MAWDHNSITELFEKPFFDLLTQAHKVHRQNFNQNQIELCALINIKTGGCPEDCGFCNQSAHFKTGLKKEALMSLENVVENAKKLKPIQYPNPIKVFIAGYFIQKLPPLIHCRIWTCWIDVSN